MRTPAPGFLHHVGTYEEMVDVHLLADVLDGVGDLGDLTSTIVG
jgi:hypothetical protein